MFIRGAKYSGFLSKFFIILPSDLDKKLIQKVVKQYNPLYKVVAYIDAKNQQDYIVEWKFCAVCGINNTDIPFWKRAIFLIAKTEFRPENGHPSLTYQTMDFPVRKYNQVYTLCSEKCVNLLILGAL